MQKSILVAICAMTSIFTSTITFAQNSTTPTTVVPKLFFEYSWLYDQNCAVTDARKIEADWSQEAKAKSQNFAEIWNKNGTALFDKVFELFGLGFTRKELTATLSVCPAPSYSNPLIINVTRFLKSYMKDKPVRSDDSFTDLVFHELLHTWVIENVKYPTPLDTKYQNEERVVRNHLHVMAMQKYIYTMLNRADLINMINEQYSNPSMPAYGRAWTIVNEIEGYEPFINEIRSK